MEEKMESQKPEEIYTCLEDVIVKGRAREAGETAGPKLDKNAVPGEKKEPKNRRHEMVESIMKLHPCATCAIKRKAAQNPDSIFAGIHAWHKTWWPGWKMYRDGLQTRCANAQGVEGPAGENAR
jgi:hypothetical protein